MATYSSWKIENYSNMAYSSNLLLLFHQNGDLLILKSWKLLKYGLFVHFLLQILLTPIYFYLLIKMVTYSSWKIKKYSNMAYSSYFFLQMSGYSSQWWLTHLGNVSKVEVDLRRTFCHFRHTLTHYLPSPTHAASDLVWRKWQSVTKMTFWFFAWKE